MIFLLAQHVVSISICGFVDTDHLVGDINVKSESFNPME